MDPTLKAFLQSWDLRLDVCIVLLTFGTMYTIGWLRLRGSRLAARWRLVSYYAGLVLLALALMSGIDVFQTQLFFVHMIQHLFLVMLAPPLLLWANPMPFLLWALPKPERRQIGRLLTQKSPVRKWLVKMTSPVVVWFFYTANLWLWHDPNPYNSAITDDFLHDIEHLTFFISGMALWWHYADASPKFHGRRPYTMRLMLVVMTYFQNLLLGVSLTMSPELIYTHYATVPRIWGLSPERDQMIGGLIMWIPGGMMYLIAFLVLVARLVNYTEHRARLTDQKRLLAAQGTV